MGRNAISPGGDTGDYEVGDSGTSRKVRRLEKYICKIVRVVQGLVPMWNDL